VTAPDVARAQLLAGLPLTERRLEIGGVSTAVLEGGAGPPIVLLHGGIECGGAYWGPVVDGLARRHRLVVPDVPGLGESAPVKRLDVDVFTDWLVALLELTGDEKPTLVAHSLFGSLASRFVTRHGDGLGRLVIYAAPAIGPYRLPFGLRVAAIRFGLRPSARNAERFERWAFLDLDRTRRRDPQWYEAFETYLRAKARVPHVKRTMRRLIGAATRRIPDGDLRRIAVPTTLLWGRADRMVPLGLAETASARFGWPLHVVDDAGHAPHIEQPEAFLRELTAALEPAT
jgi:pimeloyl-ACP methyl ester carboxylesterase